MSMPETASPKPVKRCATSRDSTTNWLSYWNIPVLNKPVTSNFQYRGTAKPSAGFTAPALGGTIGTTSPGYTESRSDNRYPRMIPPSTSFRVGLNWRSPLVSACGGDVTERGP